MNRRLNIVATPIGNYDDITLRAINVLKDSDLIVCEEFKEARRLLSHLNIQKELFSLNEHNEKSQANEIIKLLKDGKNISLISDCGTPIFSDPGKFLVQLCLESDIKVIPIPGVNSLLTALMASGFSLDSFYFAGWLSPKQEIRKKEIQKLKSINDLIIIMDTPYRLIKLLESFNSIFDKSTPVVLAYQLTMENEFFYRGSLTNIFRIAEEKKLKGEFVLILNNKKEKKR